MSRQGKLSIERMCQLAGVSRAGFYRSLQSQEPVEEDMQVRSAIQQIFAEHKRRYGYRRVSAELRRRGLLVNHKRVARLGKIIERQVSKSNLSQPRGSPQCRVGAHAVACGVPVTKKVFA